MKKKGKPPDSPPRFGEQRSEVVTVRLTPTEKSYLEQLAADSGHGNFGRIIREALDHYIEHQLRLSRKKSPGKRSPSASK